MPLIRRDDTEVIALRFDEAAVADELAGWCGGQVEQQVNPDDATDVRTVILVPGPRGPVPARLGDWIVHRPDGTFRPYRPDDFAAQFEPADEA